MTELALILVSAILVNNFVLVQFLGLCPFMGVSRKIETAIGLSLATTFVLTLAAMCSHILQRYVLRPLDLEYLRTIGFILVIAVVVQFTEMLVKKTSPLLYRVLGIFLPLITTNCIVLGVALLNANKAEYGFLQATTQGFGAGLGFSLVLVLFAALRERIAIADAGAVPRRGHRHDHRRPDVAGVHGLQRVGPAMNGVFLAIGALLPICLAGGALLGYAAVRFRVQGDPVAEQVNALLPQTQCGQCGYPGCKPYAEAIAAGDKINKCPPGGEATIRALADLLDLEPEPLDAAEETPPRVAYIREAECIGCTKCIQACPVDAIVGAARLMHTVIADECTGCDLCLEPCPVDCIEMREIPDDVRHWKWPQPSPRLIASDRERAA